MKYLDYIFSIFNSLSPVEREYLKQRSDKQFGDSKISSLYMLCEFILKGTDEAVSSLPLVKGLYLTSRSFLKSSFARVSVPPKDVLYIASVVGGLFSDELARKKTFEKMRDADNRIYLLFLAGEKVEDLVEVLIDVSDYVNLVDMADYSEMCEIYGLQNLRQVVDSAVELHLGLNPKEPDEWHSAITIALDAKRRDFMNKTGVYGDGRRLDENRF